MNTKKLFMALGTISACVLLGLFLNIGIAADGTVGVVKQMQLSRWQTARIATTTTSLTSVTNVVAARAGSVLRVIVQGGSALGTTFEIHDCKTATAATAANEVWTYSVSTNTAIGTPVTYDLDPGLNTTSGITVVTRPGETSVVDRVFLQWDGAKGNGD